MLSCASSNRVHLVGGFVFIWAWNNAPDVSRGVPTHPCQHGMHSGVTTSLLSRMGRLSFPLAFRWLPFYLFAFYAETAIIANSRSNFQQQYMIQSASRPAVTGDNMFETAMVPAYSANPRRPRIRHAGQSQGESIIDLVCLAESFNHALEPHGFISLKTFSSCFLSVLTHGTRSTKTTLQHRGSCCRQHPRQH